MACLKSEPVRRAWKSMPSEFHGYEVEPLRVHDIGQVVQIERDVFLEPSPWWRLWERYWRPEVTFIAVRDGPTIAAYFGFEVYHRTAHVLANATHPAYRRQGLAQFLLARAEPLALAHGARSFVGEVRRSNIAQQKVLGTIGWRPVAVVPGYFGNGEDAIIVWRTLGADRTGENDPDL